MAAEEEFIKQRIRFLQRERQEGTPANTFDPGLTKKQKQQIKKKRQKKKKMADNGKILIEKIENPQKSSLNERTVQDARDDVDYQAEQAEEEVSGAQSLSQLPQSRTQQVDPNRYNVYFARNQELEKDKCVQHEHVKNKQTQNDLQNVNGNHYFGDSFPAKYATEEMHSQSYIDKIRLRCKLMETTSLTKGFLNTATQKDLEMNGLELGREFVDSFGQRLAEKEQAEEQLQHNKNIIDKLSFSKRSLSLNFQPGKNERVTFDRTISKNSDFEKNLRSKSFHFFGRFSQIAQKNLASKGFTKDDCKESSAIQEGDIKDIRVVYKRVERKRDSEASNVIRYTVNPSEKTSIVKFLESLQRNEIEGIHPVNESCPDRNLKDKAFMSSVVQLNKQITFERRSFNPHWWFHQRSFPRGSQD